MMTEAMPFMSPDVIPQMAGKLMPGEPGEWKPRSMEEAIEFEGAKAGFKPQPQSPEEKYEWQRKLLIDRENLARGRPTKPENPRIIMKDTATLRKEFNALPEVKSFQEINTRYNIMEKTLEVARRGGNLIAVDQALISLFNKMTDPQSVVRESEYARTPKNMSVVNRILGKWDKWTRGGAGLTDDEREALVSISSEINEMYKQTYNKRAVEFRSYAQDYQVNPDAVAKPQSMARRPVGGATQDKFGFQMGDRKRANDGKWYTYIGENQWQME